MLLESKTGNSRKVFGLLGGGSCGLLSPIDLAYAMSGRMVEDHDGGYVECGRVITPEAVVDCGGNVPKLAIFRE